MNDQPSVLYDTEGPVARITLNRPDRLNAIDPATSRAIRDAFQRFAADDGLRVAILTGAGRAFCVGDDLKEMDAGAETEGIAADHGDVAFGGITSDFECWKPIIAAVNGFCVGGGLEVALACDIRIASDQASFGLPEPRWSLIPSAGGTQRLPRMIPRAFAMELLLTGGRVDAATALQWGIVSRVVSAEELLPAAERLAALIAANGPLAIEGIKEVVVKGAPMTLEEAMTWEREIVGRAVGSEDAREGVRAFVEKRTPSFQRR